MKLAFVHISGSKKGQTEVFEKYKILIGTHPSCDLRFDKVKDKNVAGFHAEIISNEDSAFLKDIDSKTGTFVNKEMTKKATLKDGDLIGFGKDGSEIYVRFVSKKDEAEISEISSQYQQYPEISLGDMTKTEERHFAGQKVILHKKPGRLNTVFRDFVIRPYSSASSYTKRILLAIIILVSGISFSLFYFYFYKLQETSKRIQILESQQSFVENIIEEYRKGVCFIQGSYYFADIETGKPIRVLLDGTPITSNFSGTGFLINPKGLILTNRHIAEPAWRRGRSPNREYAPHSHPKAIVKFVALRAFFPETKDPYPLEIVKVSNEADIALLRFTPTDVKLPVLRLDMSGKNVRIGEPVILLGYPAGINAMFGKTEQEVVDELIMLPVLQIAEELSRRNLIRPLATQGHVSDITPGKIIYDAQTTFGGSGGPLVNIKGEVIGINYGILRSFKGSNFAVPIKHGLNLLEK